ncbi:unnamed protein product [Wuchereria bancrofti]|uniref:Uncharacterized protein n=1 Tax=Wuchereria bancrofti TaxID=6293 RepID=A0A3P7DW11_WUCBA|nr:unnamed protein product [Wuchereria bancrofti]
MLCPMEIDPSEDIEDKMEDRSDESIACRTRNASKNKSNLQVVVINNTNWTYGIPFNTLKNRTVKKLLIETLHYLRVSAHTHSHKTTSYKMQRYYTNGVYQSRSQIITISSICRKTEKKFITH